MTDESTPGSSAAPLHRFFAEDFARLDAAIIARCMRIDGRRLYMSGVTGYFGKNVLSLLAFLHGRGATFEVTGLTRSPQHFLAQQSWCADLPWLDLRRGDARLPWPGDGNYDLLLHAATDTVASAHVDKLDVFEGIVSGTRRALDFAATHGVRRLLLTGSGAEYGPIPESFSTGIPEASPVACDASKTESAYGEGKRVSELLAALHAQRHGFSVVNARCFAFVGPGLDLGGHFAIGNFIRDALRGNPIKLVSRGEAVRSYLYGADLAVWLVILLLEAESGAKVNVGSDVSIRVLDLANRVRELVDPRVSVQLGNRSLGEQRNFYVPSIETARQIGLEVWTDLDRAIMRVAMWHRKLEESS